MLAGFFKARSPFSLGWPFWCALLLAYAASSAPGASTAAAPTAARIDGRNYTRVADWAARRQLEVVWLKRDETLQVSRGTHRLLLYVGSREAKINGIQVWLSFPVMQRGGAIYVSNSDVQTTFEPVLFPSKASSKVDIICIDPGHGGKDPGHRSSFLYEKKYTLLLAQEVQAQLVKAGFRVVLTRTGDTYVDLERRADLASAKRADLLVSLHYNATAYTGARSTARGVEVYCMTPAGASSTNTKGSGSDGPSPGNRMDSKNMLAAYLLQKSMVKGLSASDRGVRRARFAVLRVASCPAVLVEAGFMSHPVEGKQVLDAAHRKRVAQSIVEGIKAYRAAVEP